MAVPKKRNTKSRRNKRRMHIHVENPPIHDCSNCGEKKRIHTVCPVCGYYKEEKVIDKIEEITKKEEKKRDKKKAAPDSLSMGGLSKKK